MKKVLVMSHERSGTHFLIDSIAANFGYDSNVIDFHIEDSNDISNKRTLEYRERVQQKVKELYPLNTNQIFKSHHDVKFFDGMLDELKDNFHIFYIERAVCDVLTSCYHYYNIPQLTHFPQEKDVVKFLELVPYKYVTDGAYSFTKSENQVLRWKNHVEGWRSAGVTVITYESLNNNFVLCMDVVASVLGVAPTSCTQPSLGGVAPRKGVVGDHKNLFTPEQIRYINETSTA